MLNDKKNPRNPDEHNVDEQDFVEEVDAEREDVLEKVGETEEVLQEDLLALRKELDEIRLRSEEYLDGWQRARAEFANFRKRIERERDQVHQVAAGKVILRFLDVLDDLERALKNRPEGGDVALWGSGIELIYRKMLAVLEAEGVKPMQAEGQFFDPNLHEAISHEDVPDYESGQVIEVVQTGYTLGERVLRPALVRVAR